MVTTGAAFSWVVPFVICFGIWAESPAGSSEAPLAKVVNLLQNMSKTAKAEKTAEEVEFVKFQQFCAETSEESRRSIELATGQLEQLAAEVAKGKADAEALATDVAALESAILETEGELQTARSVRAKEHADYSAAYEEFSSSILAVDRAITVLKSRDAELPASLVQVQDMDGFPQEAKATIRSFLAMASGAGGLPQASAYNFQSQGVIKLLDNLRLKFKDQKTFLEKEEMNRKANFDLLAQQLSNIVKDSKQQAGQKREAKAQALEKVATASGDLASTEASKAEDEKKLADTQTSCRVRSQEYEKNQVTRAEELKAIEEAVGILTSKDVSGKQALLQFRAVRGTSLVQLRGVEGPDVAQHRERLVAFLRDRADHIGSRYLSLMATHARADPFGSVKTMIQDLIVRLMEAANSEADLKAYCDAELAANKATRDSKQAAVDTLTANVEKREADSAQLMQQIGELKATLGALRNEQQQATDIRNEEKAANAQTIDDAKAAQVAVERAMKVLQHFFGKASLIQESVLQRDMASASQGSYNGRQTEIRGVLGILEVVLSDFARLETETTSAEDQAQTAFEKFMDETNEDIAVKETEATHKANKKIDIDASAAALKKELVLTQKELSAVADVLEKLKPQCGDSTLSYSERVRIRGEELQSLQEALDILEQQDLV